jgi:hypothetical protein
VLAFISLLFGLSFILYSLGNATPPYVDRNILSNDPMYWIGNLISLKYEYPPIDFRNYPVKFGYHYFSSAQLAFVSMVTKIRAINLGFGFTVIQSSFLLIASIYVLVSEFTNDARKKTLVIFQILFTSGFEKIVIVTYAEHMLHAPFGYEYGTAAFLYTITLLVKIVKRKNFFLQIAFFLSFFSLCGIKANHASIVLVCVGIYCLWLLKTRHFTDGLLFGIISGGIFVFVYIFITKSRDWSVGTQIVFKPIFNDYLKGLYDKITCFGEWKSPMFLGVPIFVICFFALSNPIAFLSSVIASAKRKWDVFDVMFSISILTGVLLTILITMLGKSNMYFVMSIFPLCFIWMIKNYNITIDQISLLKGSIIIVYALILLISCACFLDGFKGDAMRNGISRGINHLNHVADEDLTGEEINYISAQQFEAYDWIRNNTLPQDVIIMNIKSYVPGVISERFCKTDSVIHKSETLEDAYDQVRSYNSIGMHYYIWLNYGDEMKYEPILGEKVFDNSEVSIFYYTE